MNLCPICKQEHQIDELCIQGDLPAKSRERDPLIDRMLDNKYQISYLINRGGMASVYCAHRRQIGDKVAIKVLKLDEDFDPVDLKRFQLEAATAASIKHPHVVAIHDFGLLDDIAYLVMERLEGPSLSKEIRQSGTLSLERTLTIFKQVCSAVTAAHKQGVIHRDLKPSNIIFQTAGCENDLIKVVDFGIAKILRKGAEKLTSGDFALGTPEYISPEQCLGHKVDERSDIYSLGVVLYEMLSGEVPFYNTVASATLVQHAIEPPRPLSTVNPKIPPQINDAVMKALEKSREKRYRSALEMATEFELACRSVALSTRFESQIPSSETDISSTTKLGAVNLINRHLTKDIPLDQIGESIFSKTLSIPFGKSLKAITRPRGAFANFSFENFIGRMAEMELLDEAFQSTCQQQISTVVISGDAGIGKTELINHFHRRLPEDNAIFIVGKFYEYGGETPYRPYLDGLYSLCRNFPDRNNWSPPRVEGFTNEIRNGLQEVNRLINAKQLRNSAITEENKYRAFEALGQLFVRLSALSPLILFLDDIHWADSLSLEFLTYLIDNYEKVPILVLCTLRTQDKHEESRLLRFWLRRISRSEGYRQIKLPALTSEETRTLIEAVFGNIRISEIVLRRLHQVTQGNPFYFGEILRQLMQDHKITWSGERWQCAEIEEVNLPGSILELVELHLQRLADETIQVFTLAAVVGEKFSFQLLHALTEMSKEELMDVLDIGLHEFIIKESIATEPFADDYFVFYHTTLRKVLYERLSGYRRRRLHNLIGEKLEHLNPRKLDRVAGELAYHFHHTEQSHKTFRYSLAAAEATRSIYAVEEALRYYSWAEEAKERLTEVGEVLEQSPTNIAEFYYAYGTSLLHAGKNDQAEKQLDKGLQLSRQEHLNSLEKRFLRTLGELHWSRGNYPQALEDCHQGLVLATATSDKVEQCRLLGLLGNTYFSQGQVTQALESYSESLTLACEVGERDSEGEALRHLGSIWGLRGAGDKALEYLLPALDIAREVGNRESERQVVMLIGNIHFEQGDLEKAAERYLESRTIARAIGRRRGECRIAVNMGEICRRLGKLEEAKTYFNEAYELALELQDREIEGHTLVNLGLLSQMLNRIDEAVEYFQKALIIFRETQHHSHIEAEALISCAEIFMLQDRIQEASQYFLEAIALCRDLGLYQLLAPALHQLAKCEWLLNMLNSAQSHLKEAFTIINELITKPIAEEELPRLLTIKAQIIQMAIELNCTLTDPS